MACLFMLTEMHYFITSREDIHASAIELAQVRWMKLFDYLHEPCKIVEIEHNDFAQEAHAKLNTQQRVINIYQYYQRLPQDNDISLEHVLECILAPDERLVRIDLEAYLNGKLAIRAHLFNDRLHYVDYYDQWGYTRKREFYSYNRLNYIEFFDDRADLVLREFVDDQQNPVIRCNFFINQGPHVAMIELQKGERTLRFNTKTEFTAYFLDDLVKHDSRAIFYIDRCTAMFPAMKLMRENPRAYLILHSALTPSADMQDDLYASYQPAIELHRMGKLASVIASTNLEARNAKDKFGLERTYAIPVTYIERQKPVPFQNRLKGNIVSVARIDAIKQLSYAIKAVSRLHASHTDITLSFYGNNTDSEENARLHALVDELDASDYIKFCGFTHDIGAIYDGAILNLLTSKNEGFAMSLLEAQSHGVPCVSFDIKYGPGDIIKNGTTGILTLPDDLDSFTRAIESLLDNPDRLREYSASAYASSRAFDFEHLAAKWHQFIQNEKISMK